MAVLAQGTSGALGRRRRTTHGLTAEVHASLVASEIVWRHMEAGPDPVLTPYQRFDWVSAFVESGVVSAAAPRIVVLRDQAGRPCLLLPLACTRRAGLVRARFIGGKHANFHLPVFASAAAPPASAVRAALVAAGREAGIDLFDLADQPCAWEGMPNPLAAGGVPSHADGYGLRLEGDAEAALRRLTSADARKKLRVKERRLVEALGPVTHRRAVSAAEAASFLTAFTAHKAAWFAARGIPDPYADAAIQRFLRAAASPGPARALELHALLAGGGRVLAVFGGAVDAARFSGMFTAFDPDPALARFSPGDLLLHRLLADQATRGRTAFDLGVGPARYKASLCTETIRLVDVLIPVTGAGRAVALAENARTRLKRHAKAHPLIGALVGRLRGGPARPEPT